MTLKTRTEIIKASRVYHPIELIDASYNLTRDQKRILWLFLADAKLTSEFGVKVDLEQCVLEFDLTAYERLYNVVPHQASRDVRQALDEFIRREITFYKPDESTETEQATDVLTWLGKRSYRPGRGKYIVFFNPYLAPFLLSLKNQIGPRFKELDKIINPLHTRLYTKLIESEDVKSCILNIKWMIERFQLPSSYERYSNFKQKFLKPCVDVLRGLDGMTDLTFAELKQDPSRSRSVTDIKFMW